METLHTIRTNVALASTWEIDWSPDAGPFWLVLMVVGTVVTMAAAAWHEGVN